ncbi:MAG: hypothetical protein HY272_08415 [Gammaproteobacteria bacterium]|nr:hypothetical protein [Gammaproteobacteria bacterium]
MAKPIDNNGLQNLTQSHASRLGNQLDLNQVSTSDQASTVASGRQDDAVTVSRAAEVLNRKDDSRGNGVIQSAEHASQVAQTLRGLFEGNSGLALAAQAKNVSSELMLLLKTG